MSLTKDIDENIETVLQSKTVEQAKGLVSARSGLWTISLISFVEASLPLPIITDPFLAAAILADRANTLRLIIFSTISSALGGVLAYLMFLVFFEMIMGWMTPGMITEFQALADSNSNTFVLTIIGAVTPVPYTIVAWVVGAIKGNLLVFIGASVLGRGVRYLIVGYCTYFFGPLALSYARRYIWVTTIIVAVLVGAFLWLKM